MNTTTTKPLKILYWNARGFLKHKEDIERALSNIDMLVCVESLLQPKISNINFSGFVNYRLDRTYSTGGGTILLIRSNLAYREIKNFDVPHETFEICGIQITNVNPVFSLIACYRAPGPIFTLEQWERLFVNIKKEKNCIFMGDFNAHHISWNCNKTDTNGENLLECIDKNDLFIHNSDSYSHIDTTSISNIDLILSSNNIAEKIDVQVNDETWGSDHYPIYVNVSLERHIYHKKSHKIRSTQTNWNNVVQQLDTSYEKFLSNNYDNLSASHKYEYFVNHLTEIITGNTPKKKFVNIKIHRNPAPWWDEECSEVKRQRKAAFRIWERSKDLSDFIEYKRLLALARRTFKKKKKESFVKFASTINLLTDSRYVWNTSKILKNKWIKVNASHVPENLQLDKKLEALNKICPPVKTPPDTNYLPNCQFNEFLERPFNFAEFNHALDSRNTDSSPGLDGIDYFTLKKLPIKYKLILVDIFNEMYSSSDFPSDWKKSYVHLIPKPESKGYRPIALTSSLCKLFETLIKNKFQWWVETQNILPNSQSGFRKGLSCQDNLLSLTTSVQLAFQKNKDMYAAFLDVKGAFDNVNIRILLDKLAKIGCPVILVKFISFITMERFVYADELSDPKKTYKGVPQGGVLSPLLYIIYVADIIKDIPIRVSISQFADDIALYSSNLKSLQKAIEILKNNLADIDLFLASEKTVFLHFNKRGIKPGETELQVSELIIKSSESTRFLGIIFDYQLSFVPQINKVKSRCDRASNIIKYLQGIWWGADPTTLLNLYKSYVRSILDYGIIVYYPTRKDQQKKLEGIQHNAIRLALGFRKTTPIKILLAESKLPSISERARFLGKTYVSKIISNESLLVNKSTKKYYALTKKNKRKKKRLFETCIHNVFRSAKNIIKSQNYNMYTYSYDVINSSVPFARLDNQHKNLREICDELDSPFTNVFYTDGSKSPTSMSTGSACVNSKKNIVIKRSLPKKTSVFTAECIAVKDALDLALKSVDVCNYVLCDSLSVLESLQRPLYNIKTNFYLYEIKRKYLEFQQRKSETGDIQLYWIPSHSAISGNDVADTQAKLAANCRPTDLDKLPYTDLAEKFKRDMYYNSNDVLLNLDPDKGKIYFDEFYTDSRKPWFYNKRLPRDLIVTINRLRANHYNLNASLARVSIINDPSCPCSYNSQDIDHILWHCPLYIDQRVIMNKHLAKLKLQPPLSINVLIKEPKITACSYILNFLNNCSLRI